MIGALVAPSLMIDAGVTLVLLALLLAACWSKDGLGAH